MGSPARSAKLAYEADKTLHSALIDLMGSMH